MNGHCHFKTIAFLLLSLSCLSAREIVGIVETHDRPLPGAPPIGWLFNRMGASRGLLNVAGDDPKGTFSYSQPQLGTLQAECAKLPPGELWTSAGEFHRFGHDITIGAIYSTVIKADYQPRIIAVEVDLSSAASPDGREDLSFSLQLKHESATQKEVIASKSWPRSELLADAFPRPLRMVIDPSLNNRSVNTLVWQLDRATVGDTVSIDEIRLIYEMPELEKAEKATVIWLGQLLRCYNSQDRIVDDRFDPEPDKRENVTATGKLCKILALATKQGLVQADTARARVADMAHTILHVLPRGSANLIPHFTSGAGQNNLSEWSSGDTAYTMLDLIVALRMLDLDNELAQAIAYVKSIDWAAMKAANGGFHHGYNVNGELLSDAWYGFGTETLGVLLAAYIGGVPGMMGPPPTDNGSGFIDEAGYPITPIGKDRFDNNWFATRSTAAQTQITWYANQAHASDFYNAKGLFGLSAGDRPSGWDAENEKIYQAYGIGGNHIAPLYQDNGHFVVVGHYHAMIADLRRAEALRMHDTLLAMRLLSPLNMLESMSINAAGDVIHVNALQGAWNLALGTEGWLFTDSTLTRALYQAMGDIPELAAAWRYYFPYAGNPDFDSDGLTDQAEDELGTRWDHPDTDNDGLLDANDPEPTVFNEPGTIPVLTIEPNTMRIEAGTAPPDLLQGVAAATGNGDDITTHIQVTGLVDTQALGEYSVRYAVTFNDGPEISGVRTYVVSDTTPPVLVVETDLILSITGLDLDLRAGVQAMDSFEGDLTAQVTYTGAVDTSTPGEYVITYEVADASRNAAIPQSRRYLISTDNDEDLLPDLWELEYFGHFRWNGDDDPDADGQNNRSELAAMTDPGAYVIALKAGWNLVSVAKLPPEADFASVFKPGALPVDSQAWQWAPEPSVYVRCRTLSPLAGIWVFAYTDVDIIVRP